MASLNHIGIATQDLPLMRKLLSILSLDVTHQESVPEQGVLTHFVPLPVNQSFLELLEATDPEGTISKFLKKQGPGIHHLSFNVNPGELDSISEKLSAAGFRLVFSQPKRGAHKTRINFIHPASSGGILIELMEPG